MPTEKHNYSREGWTRHGVKIVWCTCGFSSTYRKMREHWREVDGGTSSGQPGHSSQPITGPVPVSTKEEEA